MSIGRFVHAPDLMKKMEHDQLHTQKLFEKYSDLYIHVNNNMITYYSELINPEVDNCEFLSQHYYSEYSGYQARAFKLVKIDCTYCDGEVEVSARPSHIEFLMVDRKDRDIILHSFSYNELLEEDNFNPSIKTQVDLQIIKLITELSNNTHGKKVDITRLSKRIRKLLPFS